MRWCSRLVLAGLVACGSGSDDGGPSERSPDAAAKADGGTTRPPFSADAGGPTDAGVTDADATTDAGAPVEVRIVFVHGVTQFDADRRGAHEQLIGLEKAVLDLVAARGAANVVVTTARVNLYTGDDGELLSPRIDDHQDGTGLATATAWRTQLVKKTNAVFPNGKNIVFVGHSTGGRVSAEVGASEEMRDRVAGVVTVHGMIDGLQSNKYNVIGPTSYVTACKAIKPKGWCEYSGFVSGVDALDWLARERHVLSLIGASSCSPSFWEGVNDQALPLQAQSSPWSPGIQLTPTAGKTYAPAHGTFYGEFCHPDIVGNGDAMAKASDAIVRWLFDAAPRVVGMANPDEAHEVAALAAEELSAPLPLTGLCPAGRHSSGQVDVAGLCRHPGSNDGDDHPFDASNLVDLQVGTSCDATVRVAHHHAGASHGMGVWVKRYSLPEGGGLVSTLH